MGKVACAKSLVGASKKTLKSAANRLAKEKARIKKDLGSLRQAEDQINHEEKLDKAIDEIVAELRRCPDKIMTCKRYVLDDMFLEASSEDELNETFAFLHRVPAHLFKQCLELFGLSLGADRVKTLRKNDKNAIVKLFHFACMTNGQSRIPSHNRKLFKEHFINRYNQLNKPLSGEQWSDISAVDWPEMGFFGFEGDGKIYSNVILRIPERIMVALPEHVHITDDWTITDNWNFLGAKINSPPGVKPKVGWLIKDFFHESEEFQKIWTKFCTEQPNGAATMVLATEPRTPTKGGGAPPEAASGQKGPPAALTLPNWDGAELKGKLAQLRGQRTKPDSCFPESTLAPA